MIAAGDVVSVDGGAILAGWHGDSAFTTVVPAPDGALDPEDVSSPTRPSRPCGAGSPRPGRGAAERDRRGRGGLRRGPLRPGRGLRRHGIGTEMHQDPHVLNYRTRDRGPKMRPGLCLAVEPMLTRGDPATAEQGRRLDRRDGRRVPGRHWEHSMAVLDGGVWVLTARDGGEAALAASG
jgi:methionyl aminopeptidase